MQFYFYKRNSAKFTKSVLLDQRSNNLLNLERNWVKSEFAMNYELVPIF